MPSKIKSSLIILISLALSVPALADKSTIPMPEDMIRFDEETKTESLMAEIFQGCNGFGFTSDKPAVDRFVNGLGYEILTQDSTSTTLSSARHDGVLIYLGSGNTVEVCDAALPSEQWSLDETRESLMSIFGALQGDDTPASNVETDDQGIYWERNGKYFGASVFEADGFINFHYTKE